MDLQTLMSSGEPSTQHYRHSEHTLKSISGARANPQGILICIVSIQPLSTNNGMDRRAGTICGSLPDSISPKNAIEKLLYKWKYLLVHCHSNIFQKTIRKWYAMVSDIQPRIHYWEAIWLHVPHVRKQLRYKKGYEIQQNLSVRMVIRIISTGQHRYWPSRRNP